MFIEEIPLDTSFLEVEDNRITFSVNKVVKCQQPELISGEKAFSNAIHHLNEELDFQSNCKKKKKWRQVSWDRDSTMSCCAAAIYRAYQIHMSVSLSPSDFLLMIGHGFSTHINMNAAKLRRYFENPQEQRTLSIKKQNFGPEGNQNRSTISGQITEEIKNRVKKNLYSAIIDDFSTTTPTTKLLSELNLVDDLRNCFKFRGGGICGFPKLQLRGTVEDWKKFHTKVLRIKEANTKDHFDIEWWFKNLVPVVEKICEAGIDRKVDTIFWANMCHSFDEYGPGFNGWLNTFMPYFYNTDDGYKRNEIISKGMAKNFTFYQGNLPHLINEGLTKVPFLLINDENPIEKHIEKPTERENPAEKLIEKENPAEKLIEKENPTEKPFENKEIAHSMHFYAGFLGGSYSLEDEFMRPEYFWSIYQDPIREKEEIDQAEEESEVKKVKKSPIISKPQLHSSKITSVASGSKVAATKIVSLVFPGNTTSNTSGANPAPNSSSTIRLHSNATSKPTTSTTSKPNTSTTSKSNTSPTMKPKPSKK